MTNACKARHEINLCHYGYESGNFEEAKVHFINAKKAIETAINERETMLSTSTIELVNSMSEKF